MHRAGGRSQMGTRGVLKGLPRFEQGLVPDHTQASNLLVLTLCVVDVPSSRNQLRCHLACVGDGDGVTEHIHIFLWLRLVRQILWHHIHSQTVIRHPDTSSMNF